VKTSNRVVVGSFAALLSLTLGACAGTIPSAGSGQSQSSSRSPAATATVTTVTETKPIAFQRVTRNDSSLPKGQTKVATAGVDGVETFTYQVTSLNGQETGRELLERKVTTPPIDEVTLVGTKVTAAAQTKPPSNCDPNYSGCVPIASDVDCKGGSGNGPAYVQGPVKVIGEDIYDLDADNDGIACE
jgi:hypothetical protein